MHRPVIHLLSVAGHCRPLMQRMQVGSYARIITVLQQAVGSAYEVTGDTDLMNPRIDECRGGRRDDQRRSRCINRIFSDDRVKIVVALRGGAWMVRLIPHIDFELLRGRRTPLHLFGFSELTPLINIAARYRRVRAYYDHDLGHLQDTGNYRHACAAFLEEAVSMAEGGPPRRSLHGKLIRGSVHSGQEIRVVGGCLTVLVTLLGTHRAAGLKSPGNWLALEDVHDDPWSIDRHLAHLKLAGVFEKCAGLLIGDFHAEDQNGDLQDQTSIVLALLKFHLPPGKRMPIVAHCNFGHCHPAAPLPINQPLKLVRSGKSNRIELVSNAG